ncbi:LpxL/LpxP family acyltransferase [Mesoterricola sediminis]|uniref:Acyltransferase n=1 Tax=Mesoterricola sediminis TaxID=2927980 RepID=A0AA48GWG9_9BACT|nr:hypothetical protein [Mesoterricola sediminis]BDU75690.1 hypothetical protein METESE_06480 [Mesoterricola sediminis]
MSAGWRERGLGAGWQFGFFRACIRRAGRPVAYRLADLVALWYVLARPSVRARCRPYLRHRFPGRRRLLGDTLRLVQTFARLLVDQTALRLGDPTLGTTLQCREPLQALLGEGRGLIILTAHVGAWQLGMANLGALSQPLATVARLEPGDRSSPFREGAHPFTRIDPDGFLGGVPAMVGVLQQGGVLCLMGDRTWGDTRTAVAAPFLGGTVRLPSAAYRLASATGAPIAVLLPVKPCPDQFEMSLAGVIRVPPGLGRGAAPYAPHAAAFAGMLEAFLAAHPHHWFNFFDLWAEDGTCGS